MMTLPRLQQHMRSGYSTAHSLVRASHRDFASTSSPQRAAAASEHATPASFIVANAQPRIVSGIQPTGGVPHLGNYLGAIKSWVQLQDPAIQAQRMRGSTSDGQRSEPSGSASHSVSAVSSQPSNPSNSAVDVLYMIVDLHALTVAPEKAVLRRNITDMTIALLACGINPAKSVLFQQSKVSGHSELMWLLGCITSNSWLSRMTQWKAKKQQLLASKSLDKHDWGLYSYPILMAADVLLYRGTHVPVGDDQQQHLELASTLANTFNHVHKSAFFPAPVPMYNDAKRIMNLRNPVNKMSKSDVSDASRINLTDSDDDIRSKLRRALTDTNENSITFDPENRPGVANLLSIAAAIRGETPQSMAEHYTKSNLNMRGLKDAVMELVIAEVKPIREKIAELQADEKAVHRILEEGSHRANEMSRGTLQEVRKLVGLDL
ncbi:tryptophanyl tRNA synthetase 2 [Capsaspora owczarzaki ATCC 30864]|uniref:tryptophan--tRNA ligase n=1 Tax=Capsaspora owczarzaki (strain ATCC 30864) TaxID=595528 RepID=A0A0D2WMS7_CAPO3|nr:tryptophanyl tRNA synthetase 2 [Capsaspora owczarzaki ATCC 30864]KJE92240.1 tryptophanyl tRNA synthetase 2 [Capsaspora owczarzaki ATCC 30864]|eukprot:XP_004364083.2 tryptophanyl tRNA synthetase 2 [Capsaspora owczarzaki ATCC 30864]